MRLRAGARPVGTLVAGAVGAVVAAYAALAVSTWWRYGRHEARLGDHPSDEPLDRFVPSFDVREVHQRRVAASAETTFDVVCELDLDSSSVARLLFATRARVMGARHEPLPRSASFLEQMQGLGWGLLHETPGREIVMGAVTRPWEARVVFRPVPPEAFLPLSEPAAVKIAWTVRVEPRGSRSAIVRTETRVVAIDEQARSRFRRYWSAAAPGIILLRHLVLHLVKREAERRQRRADGDPQTTA